MALGAVISEILLEELVSFLSLAIGDRVMGQRQANLDIKKLETISEPGNQLTVPIW